MGYEKISDIKVLRVRHRVKFTEHYDAASIKRDIAHVPDAARLTEITEDESSGFIYMNFIEEKEEK